MNAQYRAIAWRIPPTAARAIILSGILLLFAVSGQADDSRGLRRLRLDGDPFGRRAVFHSDQW